MVTINQVEDVVGQVPKANSQEMGDGGLASDRRQEAVFWRHASWMSCQPPQEEGGMKLSTSSVEQLVFGSCFFLVFLGKEAFLLPPVIFLR